MRALEWVTCVASAVCGPPAPQAAAGRQARAVPCHSRASACLCCLGSLWLSAPAAHPRRPCRLPPAAAATTSASGAAASSGNFIPVIRPEELPKGACGVWGQAYAGAWVYAAVLHPQIRSSPGTHTLPRRAGG